MRIPAIVIALLIGGAAMAGSIGMSASSKADDCRAYKARIESLSQSQRPPIADSSPAARFQATEREYPGPGCENVNALDIANAVIGGGIIGLISLIFLLLFGKFVRWAER